MRTTLTIDDDVLAVAKDLARAEHTTAGQVISRVFRQGFEAALRPPDGTPASDIDRRLAERGIVPLPRTGNVVTCEDVDRIREELGI